MVLTSGLAVPFLAAVTVAAAGPQPHPRCPIGTLAPMPCLASGPQFMDGGDEVLGYAP